MSFYKMIESCLPTDRSAIAIECPERAGPRALWSFADLTTAAGRAAALFVRLGLKKGDRVALQTEKSPEALAIYLGCLLGGAVFLPLNTAYRREELAHILADAEPALCVCDPARLDDMIAAATHGPLAILTLDLDGEGTFTQQAELEAPLKAQACDGEDLAAILYTSGTTGRPKGAMLTHRALTANGLALRDAWRFKRQDVLLHALPIFHTHGLFVACSCALLSGARTIWLSRFILDQVIDLMPRASVFMGVPTYYVRLLEDPRFDQARTAGVRLFTSGSAPLLAETFQAFSAVTGQTIVERYGMTETGINTSNPYDGGRRAGAVGGPLPGVEVRVVDDQDEVLAAGQIGGLQVRGPNVFAGYWRRPDSLATEFAQGGWFRTGDVAKIDDDGYVHLVGRSKDLIISGGFNVYPKEIEMLLDEAPGVAESAVIGVPHPDFGEVAVAVVVPAAGATLDSEGLLTDLRNRLANYKAPKRAFIVDDLPRNVMGKVQKNLLRERYRDLFVVVAST